MFFVYIFIVVLLVKGQSCSPSSFPTDIYYPNTINTPTNVQGVEYLRGPNTIVYDTINDGCHFVCVNAGCTLIFKYQACAAIANVWLKNGSTLNILQGTFPFQIFYETGAIINNPFSIAISSNSCSLINFPTVNCNATNIKENNLNGMFHLYPNPTSGILILDAKNFTTTENYSLKIMNLLGQDMIECKFAKTINISNLKTGVYFLQLYDNGNLIGIEKIIKE